MEAGLCPETFGFCCGLTMSAHQLRGGTIGTGATTKSAGRGPDKTITSPIPDPRSSTETHVPTLVFFCAVPNHNH